MDIIFHGNCLDGCYSVLAAYTFLNLVGNYCKVKPLDLMLEWCSKAPHQNLNEQMATYDVMSSVAEQPSQLTEDFFTSDKSNRYYSLVPGQISQFTINSIIKNGSRAVLLLLDCYGESFQNLQKFQEAYKYVIVIDHHTTFAPVIKQIGKGNILYFFRQDKCAYQLTIQWLNRAFMFHKLCPKENMDYMTRVETYVKGNDLKMNEIREGKAFVIGFFYMGIDMSSSNPHLFKRLGCLSMSFVMQKGWQLLPQYLNTLKNLMEKACIVHGMGITFMGIPTTDYQYVSDLGILLCRLGHGRGYANLAMLYRKDFGCYRVSFRSSRDCPEPLAMKMAVNFGGGGHLLASGCKIAIQKFNSTFKMSPLGKVDVGQLVNNLYPQK